MKRTVITAMVLSLAVGSLALADPPQGQWQDQHHDQHHDEHHDQRHDQGEHHGRDEHRAPARARVVFNTGRYERPHGWRAHSWHRGDRLPPAYRAHAYVIPSPGVYRLRPPPAGYYWVRVDNNAVLAAVATGVVVDVAVNLFH